MTIRVRIVADDVDELDAAVLAIGRVLTVTRESRPRPRRSGDGVSLYLDVALLPVDVDAADRADPLNRCGRAGCGQYVPLADARAVPTVTDDGFRYARWHQACLRAEQRERGVRR
ncbi:hypothetical protein [Micromonospora sp. RL09-050-HVF-A]|uniref:hypothetical protein n=1 Tax=Micromonospora sp. RL09-050-HVF-A TaxID=1703433 RepID=UPI001C5F5AA3|nr:hypothetical protein [Micromonospora sp. RL09-050-HVF-A]MBW4700363.1 hypothetical protein [Micromonospora sp. RL09-050-HVF-A]